MSGKKPKRSSKNLKINTRIVLTTVLAIAIPLVLVALVCLGLLHSTSHTFQLAAETADRYSLVNQLVMAIVGNACLPQFTAYIMHCNEHIYYIAYIVPMICFAFCAYYGWKGYKIKS